MSKTSGATRWSRNSLSYRTSSELFSVNRVALYLVSCVLFWGSLFVFSSVLSLLIIELYDHRWLRLLNTIFYLPTCLVLFPIIFFWRVIFCYFIYNWVYVHCYYFGLSRLSLCVLLPLSSIFAVILSIVESGVNNYNPYSHCIYYKDLIK